MESENHGKQTQRDETPDTPFGEDITNPDSRTMPFEFHGEWVRDPSDCYADRSATRKIITSDRIVIGDDVQRVVAVRFIHLDKIVLESGLVVSSPKVAVVTIPADETEKQQYSLFYFGLSEDGNSLVDLENMDWVLQRCSKERRLAPNPSTLKN